MTDDDGAALERICVRLPPAHLEVIDELVAAGEYPNRAEALREAARIWVAGWRDDRESVVDGRGQPGDGWTHPLEGRKRRHLRTEVDD